MENVTENQLASIKSEIMDLINKAVDEKKITELYNWLKRVYPILQSEE